MAWTAFGSLTIPLVVTAGGLISLWVIRWPRLTLLFFYFSLIAGQIVRLPLPGQGGGLLLSDIAVVLVVIQAVWQLRRPLIKAHRQLMISWSLSLCPFIAWSLWTLAVNWSVLSSAEMAIAGSYWIRLVSLLLLLPALLVFTDLPVMARRSSQYFVLTIAALVLLGFAQLIFVPHLRILGAAGWDPHEHRLVSTWLDPNFFGGFLGLVLPWLIAIWSRAPTFRQRWAYSAVVVLSIMALLFTRSRSSLVAIALSWLLLTPLYLPHLPTRWRRPMTWIPAGILLGLIGLMGMWLLGQRAVGLVTYDPTVTLRLTAFKQIWPLAVEHSWVGVGYNAYQFAAQQVGLIGDFTIHSRAGADNSLLTLWVTTGLPGVILFLLPWLYLGTYFFRQWLRQADFIYIAWFISWITWFIHAQFVNSLLYSHLFIMMVIISVLTLHWGLSAVSAE